MIDLKDLATRLLAGAAPHPGTVLVPEGFRLEPTERFGTRPDRHRGTYKAATLTDFAQYLHDEADPETSRVFLDPDKYRAVAVLDHGDGDAPLWGEHRATWQPEPTPEWGAVVALTGAVHNQDAMLNWLADWGRYCRFWSTTEAALAAGDADSIAEAAAIASFRSIGIQVKRDAQHDQDDRSRQRSTFERAAIATSPPGAITLEIAPFDGFSVRRVVVRLAYHIKDNTDPLMRTHWIGRAQLTKDIATEYAELVAAAIPEDVSQYVGTFSRLG